jgi:hypothetical protein
MKLNGCTSLFVSITIHFVVPEATDPDNGRRALSDKRRATDDERWPDLLKKTMACIKLYCVIQHIKIITVFKGDFT